MVSRPFENMIRPIDRLYYQLKNELNHASIMRNRADREKRIGLPQCMYRGHEASSGYSLHMAKNILREMKMHKNEKVTKICEEIEHKIRLNQFQFIDRLISQLRVLILGR